jgi:hypothetical protein
MLQIPDAAFALGMLPVELVECLARRRRARPQPGE